MISTDFRITAALRLLWKNLNFTGCRNEFLYYSTTEKKYDSHGRSNNDLFYCIILY